MNASTRNALLRLLVGIGGLAIWAAPHALGQQPTAGTLQDSLRQRVRDAFDLDPTAISQDVAVFMTKPLTATVLSEVISRSKATMVYRIAGEKTFVPPPLTLKTADLPDAHMGCNRDDFCKYGCDSPKPWEKFGCEVDKEACRDTQKFDCERRKSMASLISDQELATVSFKEVIVSGGVSASQLRTSVSQGLDRISLDAALMAALTVSGSGYLKPTFVVGALPLFVGLPPCVAHEFHFVDEPVEVNESKFHVDAGLEFSSDGDDVVVQVHLEDPTVTLHFAGTPALRYLARNPLAVMACPVPYALAGLTNLTHPNDTAKLAQRVTVPDQKTKIGTVTVASNGFTIKRSVRVTQKAIGLVGDVTPK